jgi:hypothetical protein
MCDADVGLSFWAKLDAPTPVLPVHRRVQTLDPNKFYVAFQTNEGDTPKILTGMFQGTISEPLPYRATILSCRAD